MGHPKSTSRKFREEFDRDRMYTVNKFFVFNGKQQPVNSIFEKEQATTRRLRQLYEGRYLNMAAPDFNVDGGRVAMPNFPRMADPDLREWLAANGLPQKDIARRLVMIGRAVRHWHSLNSAKADKVTPIDPTIEANSPPAPEISPVASASVADVPVPQDKARAPTGRRRARVKVAKEVEVGQHS